MPSRPWRNRRVVGGCALWQLPARAVARFLPDAPTVAETLPGYEASIWLGVMAPAQTPAPIIEKLNGEINRIMSLPATRDAQMRAGAEVNPMNATAFGDFLRQDIINQAEGIRISGMKAN